jgi:hypothetical protein
MDTRVHPDSRQDLDVLLEMVVTDPVWFEEALAQVAAALVDGQPTQPTRAQVRCRRSPRRWSTFLRYTEQWRPGRLALGRGWALRTARSPPHFADG